MTKAPEERVTINCKASASVSTYIVWYLQKSGQAPLLIILALPCPLGSQPGSGAVTQGTVTPIYSLIISVVEADDGDYHQESVSFPLTARRKTSLVSSVPVILEEQLLPAETSSVRTAVSVQLTALCLERYAEGLTLLQHSKRPLCWLLGMARVAASKSTVHVR